MSRPAIIKPGTEYGRWTVRGEGQPLVSTSGKKRRQMRCECACGVVRDVLLDSLRYHLSRGCVACHLAGARAKRAGKAQPAEPQQRQPERPPRRHYNLITMEGPR